MKSKPRKYHGLTLVHEQVHDYYETLDGRYQIHGRHSGRGKGIYWVIDTTTGDRVNDYFRPAYEYEVSAWPEAGTITQRFEASYGSLSTNGFRDMVAMLKRYLEQKGEAVTA